MATTFYKERTRAARAEARAKREAQRETWRRRAELSVEVRRLALSAVKASIRARGDKVQLYSLAQLRAQAQKQRGLALREQRAHGHSSALGAVFLDARRKPGTRFAQRFPAIAAACHSAGYDPARQLIPIRPAAHYHMGGIAVDAAGRSSVPGL